MRTPPEVTLRPLVAADAETLAAWALDDTFVGRPASRCHSPIAGHSDEARNASNACCRSSG